MDIGTAVISFVVISILLVAVVLGVMYRRGVNIQDIRLQNKIIAFVAGPCLVVLVSIMDVSLTAKIIIFGVAALAGVAHLTISDKIREAIYGRKSQEPPSQNNK